MENFKAIFDLSKLPTKFFILFSAVSGFVLFAKLSLLTKLHLEDVNKNYGWIVGLIFIISSSLVVINFIIWCFDKLTSKRRLKKLHNNFKANLKNLDIHEKAVIREFIINSKSSIEMPIDDSVVSGLLKKGILVINKQFGNSFIMHGTNASISLNSLADEALTLDDLDLNGSLSEDDKRYISESRPSWTKKWGY